jgi:hypothetical protein
LGFSNKPNKDILDVIGEVQESPASNTILDRLKDIVTALGSVEINSTGMATEAKQDDIITALAGVSIDTDAITGTGEGAKTLADIVTTLDDVTNLDIALSALRDAIVKTGETSKTLADIVAAIENIEIGSSGSGTTVSTTFARPDNATPYTALDVVGTDAATNMTFSNIPVVAGGLFTILGAAVLVDKNAVPSGHIGYNLHLFNAEPTPITDNLAFNLIAADRSKYLGYIEIPTMVDLGDTTWGQKDTVFTRKLAAESTTLYGVLQAVGSETPVAQSGYTVLLNIVPA